MMLNVSQKQALGTRQSNALPSLRYSRQSVCRPVTKAVKVGRQQIMCKAVATTAPPDNQSLANKQIPDATKVTAKTRVIVLGSGWGAMSFIKGLPKNVRDDYDIVVVSPRNYFLYTPLLPACATGNVEERSIVEAVRAILGNKGTYYEAVCKDIDPEKKEMVCCFPSDAGMDEACFKLSYDMLVMSVGCVNNTFGISGVNEYCNFFKSIEDANSLRRRVSECFERAALPGCPEEVRRNLLSFVIVGGGPTGVEVAAEMYDMISEDFTKIYKDLVPEVTINVVDLSDHVLSTYDRAISNFTHDVFSRAGIKMLLNSRVQSVKAQFVSIVNKAGETIEVPYGACVWATGIAMNPLIKETAKKLPGQSHFRSILTDEFLRVKGTNGSIYAVGDAATIAQSKALEFADNLFTEADTDGNGTVSMGELKALIENASKRFPQLQEHARFLDSGGATRFSNLVLNNLKPSNSPLYSLSDSTELTKEEFSNVLAKIDSGLRGLPATAQVAKQQGEFVAELFGKAKFPKESTGEEDLFKYTNRFAYFHKGSAAYIGKDNAVFDVPVVGNITGVTAGLLWKGFETFSQISFRNQILVATDLVRTKLFGRDISRV